MCPVATSSFSWLRAAREADGRTQTDAAQAAKLSRAYYNRLEQGVAKPSPEAAARLAAVFGVDADRLFASTPTPAEVCAAFLKPVADEAPDDWDPADVTDPRWHPDTDPDVPDVRGLEYDELVLDFANDRIVYCRDRKVVATDLLARGFALRVRTTRTPAARRTPPGGRPRHRTLRSGSRSAPDDDPAPARLREGGRT